MYKIDFSHPCFLHFVGIGGVSMSGLAELLSSAGFRITGSDRARTPITDMLESRGIRVFYGQKAENIEASVDCVVFTAAIRPDNPEYIAAQERQLPCLTRGQLMGQIMKNYSVSVGISGTHGKTTTTSMVGEILLAAGVDPTLSVGGGLKDIGGCMHIGKSEYFVVESCEYTNSFLDFPPKIGIILNIDADHLDFFRDLAHIRDSFRRYALMLPRDGCLIINGDIENTEEITAGLPCSVITFGSSPTSDYSPDHIVYDNMGRPSFTVHAKNRPDRRFSLQVPGEHNVYNALAAIALADLLSVEDEVTAGALLAYGGTDRRFEYKGTVGGVTVVDDYAHHPTEITATLKSAANCPHKTLWCVFQPHTYSRTKAFLKEFAQALSLADKVVLTDIYAARETDNLGISAECLQKEILALGQECHYFSTFDEVENFLLENCINGDLLITMGAGDVFKIGESLLGE